MVYGLLRWRWLAVGAVAIALLVAAQIFARQYLGVHYPTDTVGSLLTATAGTSAVIASRRHIDRWVRLVPWPEVFTQNDGDQSPR